MLPGLPTSQTSFNKNSQTVLDCQQTTSAHDDTFSTSSTELCNSFLQFFKDKFTQINSSLTDNSPSAAPSPVNLPTVTPETRLRICPISKLMSSKTTTCSLDPLYFSHQSARCPYIVHISNLSLAHGTVSSNCKTAAITTILKMPGLDPTILNNFHPITNLPFLAKTLERTVAS
jgi:hypothetical protein